MRLARVVRCRKSTDLALDPFNSFELHRTYSTSDIHPNIADTLHSAIMFRTRVLNMQPTRFLSMQSTMRMRRPVPKEEHSAHTISQRLRTLKKIPPELIPLGVVLAVAVGAAFFSMGRKLYTDKQLRLTRQRGNQ